MKGNDDIIKKTLQSNIKRIDDDFFTKRIVELHLAKTQVYKNKSFTNFLWLIIGISSVLVSFGFVLIIRQNNSWVTEIGLTENHGFILIILSVVILIYKGLEEFTTSNTH